MATVGPDVRTAIDAGLEAPMMDGSFSEQRIRLLGRSLAQTLGRPVEIGARKEYGSCDYLVTTWNSDGACAPPNSPQFRPDWEIDVAVSRRGPLFAVLVFQWTRNVRQIVMEDNQIPKALQERCNIVRGWGSNQKVTEVPKEYWAAPAGKRLTELDSEPASVFDVLFSELI